MTQICISGWSPGLRKVSLTKLLQTHAGMSLGEAKAATDRVLVGQKMVFLSNSQVGPNTVVAQFIEMGARAAIVEE